MTLTLQKTEKIKIDMPRFIQYMLCLYRLEIPQQNGRAFYNDIHYAILAITHTDIRDYDAPLYTMNTIIKNAYIYATENDYSQAVINVLKNIIDLL